MRDPTALRTLAPLGLLVLLAACDRPHAPPPPTAAGSPATPSTVSLSGTILAPQPNPVSTRPAAAGTSAAARSTTATSSSASGADYLGGDALAGDPTRDGDLDNDALREFQAEQEQRDRELLERDMDEARTIARDAPPPERDDRQPYDLPPEDGDWTAADESPPPDDEPPLDDEPPADDRYYDPRDSGFRR